MTPVVCVLCALYCEQIIFIVACAITSNSCADAEDALALGIIPSSVKENGVRGEEGRVIRKVSITLPFAARVKRSGDIGVREARRVEARALYAISIAWFCRSVGQWVCDQRVSV